MKFHDKMIQSILAGFSVGIGGILSLAIEDKLVWSLLFTLGLFTICTRGYHLFTGRSGYLLDNGPAYLIDLLQTWIGNLIGAGGVAVIMSFTRYAEPFVAKAQSICETKLSDSLLSVFLLAIFCNVLMYLAVDGYRNNPHEVGKYIILFLCVSGFIMAGFEHCVANMFYFTMAGVWDVHACIWMAAMSIGNLVGGILLPGMAKLAKL